MGALLKGLFVVPSLERVRAPLTEAAEAHREHRSVRGRAVGEEDRRRIDEEFRRRWERALARAEHLTDEANKRQEAMVRFLGDIVRFVFLAAGLLVVFANARHRMDLTLTWLSCGAYLASVGFCLLYMKHPAPLDPGGGPADEAGLCDEARDYLAESENARHQRHVAAWVSGRIGVPVALFMLGLVLMLLSITAAG